MTSSGLFMERFLGNLRIVSSPKGTKVFALIATDQNCFDKIASFVQTSVKILRLFKIWYFHF